MYEEIIEAIKNNQLKIVKEKLLQMHVQDIADFIESMETPSYTIKLFKLLPKDISAEVFSYIDSDNQKKLISVMTDTELSYLIEELYINDAVDLVEEMPANIVQRILKNTTKETRQTINKFLGYKEYSAGSIMTPEIIDLKEDMDMSACIKRIKLLSKNVETINIVYVTDKSRVLKGVLSIKDIILADESTIVGDIMNTNVVYAQTTTNKEEIARLFKQYNHLAIPIVDKEKRLVGIVTFDDIIEVIEDATTKNIAKMSGAIPNEKPYLKTSTLRLWINRAPWLMLLLISATFTGLIISKNESILSAGIYGIILTSCIPMIMGTGGNASGQASATIIRGIALNEIDFKDIFKVMFKEFKVSLLLGSSLAILCFGKILFIDGLIFKINGVTIISALVISLAMFVTIIISKIVGCTLPLLAKKLKLDPAVVANPFITTIIDILSLLIYCQLVVVLL